MNKFWFLISLVIFLMGCSSNAKFTTKGANKRNVQQRYSANKTEKYETDVKAGNVTYFVCSYYGEKFQGRPTANGETFDMAKMTCAHKTLPFNTRLRVTNEDNGKSVIVRVNDRGPFIKGRDLDLSKGAAEVIGLIPYGVKKLKIEFLEKE